MKIVSYNIAKRMNNLAEKEMPYFTKLFGFKAFRFKDKYIKSSIYETLSVNFITDIYCRCLLCTNRAHEI